jgi:magnesium-protoporphyrin IX monomethyl ester (oxidative) cyclase
MSPDGPTAEVCLVLMPYAAVSRPSIALGVLKASLAGTGVRCVVEYANLAFAERIGLDALRLISASRIENLVGEWTFAGAAFPERRWTAADLLGRANVDLLRSVPGTARKVGDLLEIFEAVREAAVRFVDDTAQALLSRRPRVVGCSSTFEQHCASLALLRRIKALDPSVVTLLGGANCEAEMGWTTLREFPWLDFVVSGEADALFRPLCRLLLERGAAVPAEALPHGVLGRAHVTAAAYGRAGASVPRAVVERLDDTPVPDYAEYFATLARSPLRPWITPALVVETSRGCWWGQKSQCTFCGLNGTGMAYRAKSPGRALAELGELAARHGVRRFQVVDNILDMQHLRTLLPALAREGAPYDLFYEIKANLRREQVAALASAGVVKVQPGIEGLHDGLLRLMAKGNTAAINLQLLKYAREYGVSCVWLLLAGFPGEDDRWHQEVAAWLPLIHHLQPPSALVRVRYDRFSVYHQRPEAYGLRLMPHPAYAAVYPVPAEAMADLVYFFVDGAARPGATPGIEALSRALDAWQAAFAGPIKPVLCVSDRGDVLDVLDTRACAFARRATLAGLDAEVYRACEPAVAAGSLRARLAREGTPAGAVDAALARLVERQLVLPVHDKYLALGIPGDVPLLHAPEDSPGGWMHVLNRPLAESVKGALQALAAGGGVPR